MMFSLTDVTAAAADADVAAVETFIVSAASVGPSDAVVAALRIRAPPPPPRDQRGFGRRIFRSADAAGLLI